MALALMLRPSDIAPHARIYDSEVTGGKPLLFTTSNILFSDDGSAKITFMGIKNDTNRTGFPVILQPVKNDKINPVNVLKNYIARTDCYRDDNKAVFLALRAPYKPISSDSVAQVLNECLRLAGLNNQGFSAKDFRPTGATVAIDNDIDPEIAMRIGRWKTRSVFFDHYVHSRPSSSYTENILLHD